LAPPARSAFTASRFPDRAAIISTVSPLFVAVFASAPAASNSFTTLPLPFEHATDSGGTP